MSQAAHTYSTLTATTASSTLYFPSLPLPIRRHRFSRRPRSCSVSCSRVVVVHSPASAALCCVRAVRRCERRSARLSAAPLCCCMASVATSSLVLRSRFHIRSYSTSSQAASYSRSSLPGPPGRWTAPTGDHNARPPGAGSTAGNASPTAASAGRQKPFSWMGDVAVSRVTCNSRWECARSVVPQPSTATPHCRLSCVRCVCRW